MKSLSRFLSVSAALAALLLIAGCKVPGTGGADGASGSNTQSATVEGGDKLTLSWTASAADAQAVHYEVRVKDLSGKLVHIENVTKSRGRNGEFSIPIVLASGDYTAEITAVDADGNRGTRYAGKGSVKVENSVANPGKPTSLELTEYSFSADDTTYSAKLSWSAPASRGTDAAGVEAPAIAGYTVYYAKGDAVTIADKSVEVTETDKVNAVISGLEAGSGYAFIVTASNGTVKSAPSDALARSKFVFTLTVAAEPAAENTKIKADWTRKDWPATGMDSVFKGYKVYVYRSGDAPVHTSGLLTGVTYTTPQGLASGTYTVGVRVVRKDDTESVPSKAPGTITVTTRAEAPGKPTLNQVTGTITKTDDKFSVTAALTWSAPSAGKDSDGNAATLTEYTVYYAEGGSVPSTGYKTKTSATLTTTVEGLKLGQSYTFAVTAKNSAESEGERSAPQTMSAVNSQAEKPGAPTALALAGYAFSSDTSYGATLSWTAPSALGKLPDGSNAPSITGYTVYYKAGDTVAVGSPLSANVATGTSHTISGFNPNNAYAFIVTASNGAENSAGSEIYNAPVLKFALKNVAAAVDGNKVTVSWERDGWTETSNPAVKGFKVYIRKKSGEVSTVEETSDLLTALSYQATLTTGTYTVAVAVVRADDSETARTSASGSSTIQSLARAPGAPGMTAKPSRAYAGSGASWTATATVNWTAPTDKGNTPTGAAAAITGYTVYYAKGETVSTQSTKKEGITATATSTEVTGLELGSKYTFIVTASNDAGLESAPSASQTMDALVSHARAPAAPTGFSVESAITPEGTVTATASWTILTGNSLSPGALANGTRAVLTEYTVYYAEGSTVSKNDSKRTVLPPAVTLRIPGLKRDTAYAFMVMTKNDGGLESEKSTLFSMPAVRSKATAPGKPTILNLNSQASETSGKIKVTVIWTLPTDKGKRHDGTTEATITGYKVYYAKGASVGTANESVDAETSPKIVDELDTGSYTFMVVAVNNAGKTSESLPKSVQPPGSKASVPGPPTGVAISLDSSGDNVVVSWTPPTGKGTKFDGSPAALTGYVVYYAQGNTVSQTASSVSAGADASSATVSYLSKTEAYTFMVEAINEAGLRARSTPKTVPALLYKPDFPDHNTKFSLGDFDSGRLFFAKGLPEGTLSAEIVIKEGNTQKFPATGKNTASLTVPEIGELHFGIAGMTHAQWAALNDAEHTIEVTLKSGPTEVLKRTFTVTKSADGDIYTWRDLQNIQRKLDGDYSLRNDIALPDTGTKGLPEYGFRPLGYATSVGTTGPSDYIGTPFSGSLAGNGKTISNLTIDATKPAFKAAAGGNATDGFIGLFGSINITGAGKSISNLTINLERLTVSNEFAVVGVLAGEITAGSIYNITVSGNKIDAGVAKLGGLAAVVETATLSGTNNLDLKSSTADLVGGLVGDARSAAAVFGINNGAIESRKTLGPSYGAGGLVGQSAGTLRGINKGNVTTKVGGVPSGGLAGIETAGGVTEGIVIGGVVTSGNDWAGYLVGYVSGATTIRGYWGTPGDSEGVTKPASKAIGTNVDTVDPTGERKFIADPSNLEKRADGSYYLDDGDPDTTTDGTEVFTDFTFGTGVGEWTWTDGQWPSINLGPPTTTTSN